MEGYKFILPPSRLHHRSIWSRLSATIIKMSGATRHSWRSAIFEVVLGETASLGYARNGLAARGTSPHHSSASHISLLSSHSTASSRIPWSPEPHLVNICILLQDAFLRLHHPHKPKYGHSITRKPWLATETILATLVADIVTSASSIGTHICKENSFFCSMGVCL